MSERQKIRILSKADCDISYFVGSGAGGQNKQKNCTGVQIIHRESGAIGRCSESRSQAQNKKTACEHMFAAPKFKLWLSKKLYEIQQKETMEQAVERAMRPENLEVEIKNEEGVWVKIPTSQVLP